MRIFPTPIQLIHARKDATSTRSYTATAWTISLTSASTRETNPLQLSVPDLRWTSPEAIQQLLNMCSYSVENGKSMGSPRLNQKKAPEPAQNYYLSQPCPTALLLYYQVSSPLPLPQRIPKPLLLRMGIPLPSGKPLFPA